jgi:hypothetical protein
MTKDQIKLYYRRFRQKYLSEILEPLQSIKKVSDGVYLVSGDKDKTSGYYTFEEVDYEDLYGPKLDKDPVTCWEMSWDFTDESPNTIAAWTRITGTAPKVLDMFMRDHKQVDVIFYRGMRGTTTEKLYRSDAFIEHMTKLFSDKFDLHIARGAYTKFFLINKNIDLSVDKKLFEKDLSKYKDGSLEEQRIISKNPGKYKNRLKGSVRTEILKEQIERIILKKLYLK